MARKLEYLFCSADRRFFILVDSENDYDTFQLRAGSSPATLTEIPVSDVTRYPDGGTTIIETEQGTLSVPFQGVSSWVEPDGTQIILEEINPLEAF